MEVLNLVIEVGNSKIAIGVFDREGLKYDWTIETDSRKTEDDYGMTFRTLFQFEGLDWKEFEGAIMCSVVPTMDQKMKRMCQKYLHIEPMTMGPGIKTGINILYENPREVGSDRIVNAVAGITLYGAPLIIVDFGTATTFCYINERKQYVGGAIAPGMNISMDALYERASKLPKIETVKTKSVIGKNTIQAMQSGFLYSVVGQVEGIVKRMKKEANVNPKVIATGELASIIKEETAIIDEIDNKLTLKGLQVIYERNHA